MEYNFREIEKKWHDDWVAKQVYKVEMDPSKPKYYVLDMFPYPSGAGLHVVPFLLDLSEIVFHDKKSYLYRFLIERQR